MPRVRWKGWERVIMSLQGFLLVASPRLADSGFSRAVILLLRHDENGAMGVLLNRPTTETISGLWQKIGGPDCQNHGHVNFGGPVSGPLFALHDRSNLAEFEVPPGIFLAAEKGHLDRLVRQKHRPVRLFVGHAGWEKGKLEEEIASGAWHLLPAKREHIFNEQDDLWGAMLRKIGHSFVTDVLKVKHIPTHPTLN